MTRIAFTQSRFPTNVKSFLDKTKALRGMDPEQRGVAHLSKHLKLPEHSSPEKEKEKETQFMCAQCRDSQRGSQWGGERACWELPAVRDQEHEPLTGHGKLGKLWHQANLALNLDSATNYLGDPGKLVNL